MSCENITQREQRLLHNTYDNTGITRRSRNNIRGTCSSQAPCAGGERRPDDQVVAFIISERTAPSGTNRIESVATTQKKGLIERLTENGEQEISINDHGLSVLRREYELYRRIFDAPEVVELTGTVCMGLGEGRYFVSLPGYKKQFETRLGYEPFEGTLNVELTSESVRRRSAIGHMNAILIEGWEDEERTYGPVVCYPATLRLTDGEQYEPAHIVAPKRTHHDEDQLEVLAPDELREVLSLEEGDQVTVRVKER